MKYDPKGYHGPSTLKRHEPDSPESIALRKPLTKGTVDPNVSMWGAPWPVKEENAK